MSWSLRGGRLLDVGSWRLMVIMGLLAAAQEQGPKMIAVLAHSLAVEADAAEHRLAAEADRLAVMAHRVAAEAHAVVEIGIAHRVELYTPQQAACCGGPCCSRDRRSASSRAVYTAAGRLLRRPML
jgi:hypothetical protein